MTWLAWRAREDKRARNRLGGYAVLPLAYRAAVEAVERNSYLVVEEKTRMAVHASVPRNLAVQIETVIADPHWREFLRRVRAVALEVEARATRPIPAGLDGDEAESSSRLLSTAPGRDPRGAARQRSKGLRPRRT